MHNLNLLTILLLLYALLAQCSDSSTEPPIEYGKVKLIAETTAASFVRLKLEITSEQTYDAFRVERNGNSVKESDITGTDTVFYDGGLKPQSAYNYKAILLKNGRQIDTSTTLTVTTTAATSHDFTWRVDTLGVYDSYLRSVTVIAEDNVWAAGLVRKNEPDTVWNTYHKRCNLIHWNGAEYEYIQLPVSAFDGQRTVQDLTAIVSFSEDDIWAFAVAGGYLHWDGTEWSTGYIHERKGTVKAAWGTSSSDMYMVGDNGTITYYDGSSFTLMESGTEEDLYDIEGVVDPQTGQLRLWAAGTRTLLYSEGQNWRIISSRSAPFFPEGYVNPRALFIPDHLNLMVTAWGSYKAQLYVMNQLNVNDYLTVGQPDIFAYGMDGNDKNDIIITGDYNATLHYNGKNLKSFTGLQGDSFSFGIAMKNNHVFIVGWDGAANRALFIHGFR